MNMTIDHCVTMCMSFLTFGGFCNVKRLLTKNKLGLLLTFSFMETLTNEDIGKDLCRLLSLMLKENIPPVKSVHMNRWLRNPYFRGTYSYRSIESVKAGITEQVQ